ncbi:MAG: glutamine amidotransferase, partial [Gammaproteobacteria bacterium]
MKTNKPFLILQLRPEDSTSDNEFEAFLKYGRLDAANVKRVRIEKNGIPEFALDDFSGIIVGGSPFDISTLEHEKSAIQKKIEADFKHLFDKVIPNDFPFLGACSGNGLLGSYLGTSISTKYPEPVSCANLLITKEGKEDPLLSGFPDNIDVLLGHKEACDNTPDGA